MPDGSPSNAPSAFRYADLFAGIGGFAAALSAMGGEHTYAVEIDKAAALVYERNWGSNPHGDITLDATDSVMKVGPHDIIAGGFPCQPFSKSGAQKGMEEIRGTLFFNIMEVIQARKPTLVVLENVRNLVGPRHTHEWAVIIERLRAEGYQVSEIPAIFSPHQIDPAFGGSPQVRERVFITATLAPKGHIADPMVRPISLLPETRMQREWDLTEDLPLDNSDVSGTDLSEEEVTWIEHWEQMVQFIRACRIEDADRVGEPARRLPGFPIWANVWTESEAERLNMLHPSGIRVPAWKANFLIKNWELFDRLKDSDSRWLTAWLRTTREFPESRQKLEWQAQDETSIWNCVISLRPSGLRVKRMTHLPALVAITQTPILGPQRRRLSTREAARLQGLPDEFDFGTQRAALTYKQLGNGVNVGVVWNVLKAHVARDADLLSASAEGRAILAAVSNLPAHPLREVQSVLRKRVVDSPGHYSLGFSQGD